jgi:hypothetical protein
MKRIFLGFSGHWHVSLLSFHAYFIVLAVGVINQIDYLLTKEEK